MSERFPLEATSREVIGKKVKQLRAKGQIPAVIYGPKQEPLNIVVQWSKLRPVLSNAGGTHLIDIQIDGNKIPTLVRSVQRHHIYKDVVLHVDFYAVDLSETVVAAVPLVLINEEETAREIGGQIIQEHSMIEVECLPDRIPSEIVLDVSKIKEIGDYLYVSDLPQIEGVTYLLDEEQPLVRSDYRPEAVTEEVEEEELDTEVEPELITRQKDEDFEE
ncbi:MAG: 50S ribosomal protein L25 [Phototrophicales bacterium]|nr:MAG: 50S ribosomal protein L25 [Phototrophicales bacterium]